MRRVLVAVVVLGFIAGFTVWQLAAAGEFGGPPPCRASELRPELRAHGYTVREVGSYEVERVRCAHGWAGAVLRPTSDWDGATALFRVDHDEWHLVVVGTSLRPADHGVPASTWSRILP